MTTVAPAVKVSVAIPAGQPEYHKKFTGRLVDANGVVRHFINGAYGREGDLPSIECPVSGQLWYVENPKRGAGFGARDSVEHRVGGPAVIRPNGDRYWYKMGKLHREDGPAIELVEEGINKYFEDGTFIRCERIAVVVPQA